MERDYLYDSMTYGNADQIYAAQSSHVQANAKFSNRNDKKCKMKYGNYKNESKHKFIGH